MISGIMIVDLEIIKKPHFGDTSIAHIKRMDCSFPYILKFPIHIEVPTNYMKNTFIKGAPFLITNYGETIYD